MLKALAALILAVTLLMSPAAVAQSPDEEVPLETFTAWDEERFEELLGQGDPVKEEQVVYSITPWNGVELSQGTIAVQDQDTIYLIANANNLVNVRRTDIYYWPITKEYMANWNEKNIPVEGSLRIRQGRKVVATLEPTTYVNYFPAGSSGTRQVVLGDEGVELYEKFSAEQRAYWDLNGPYNEADIEYQSKISAIIARVTETGQYMAEDEVPKAPRQPVGPQYYVYAPNTAFVVNLPPGNYEIELVDPNGEVVPETTKRLEVFAPRRVSVGYQVRPEAAWTKYFHTLDSDEVMYLDGRRIFYLVPFEAEEYNVYQYLKSQNLHQPLHGEGLKSAWEWVPTKAVDLDVKVQVFRDGELVQEVPYRPYLVRQTSGYALGYHILEWDRDDVTMYSQSPSFIGYRLDVDSPSGSYKIQLVDSEGNVLPGSTREIRSVQREANVYWVMYLMPVLPLAIGTVIYLRRRRLRPRSGKHSVSA